MELLSLMYLFVQKQKFELEASQIESKKPTQIE